MYDVFISYSSRDKEFVKRLATDLVVRGINVWFDDWEMRPGDFLLDKISAAIQGSYYLFVTLSPNSVSSRWVKHELRQAMHEEISSENIKVVPIIYQQCSIPDFLKDKVYVDLSQEDSYEYGLQSLVDLVFDHPLSPNRPQIGRQLIEAYESLLHSRDPDPDQFEIVAHDLLSIVKKLPISPIEEETYYHENKKLGELNLSINDLLNSLEAYQCAYQYAQDHEDTELIIQSGIPMACILAYLRRTEEAVEAFGSILEKVAEDVPEGGAINLASFLEYTVQVCFYEHYEMVNPLVLVFHNDHHRLNLRIQQAIDALYASVLIHMSTDLEDSKAVLALKYAELLDVFGLLRPALKYYSIAQRAGITEAEKGAEKVRNSQETAIWMSKYFLKGIEPPDSDPIPQTGLAISNPQAFKRILMCSGSSDIFDVEDVFAAASRRDSDTVESAFRSNGISPIRVLIYEDFPGSSNGICAVLTQMQIGVVIAIYSDDAEIALQEFSTIELYVADHHEKESGMVPIMGVLYERDFVKKNYPNIVSALLCQEAEERLAKGFISGGGNYVIASRNKTDRELAQELMNILQHRRKPRGRFKK